MQVNTYKETRAFLTIQKINSFNYLLLQGEEAPLLVHKSLGGKNPKELFLSNQKKQNQKQKNRAWMLPYNLDINNYH